jgi:SAM-dependent methyltransferase
MPSEMPSTLDRFQSIDPALLDIHAGDRVIDLGCGTGRHVLELSKRPGVLYGADLSRHDLRVARYLLEIMRRRGEVRARVHWLQMAGERLPFANAAFDRVICTETLEHVEDDRVLAHELVRVLKPGGILAISVPDEYSEKVFWKLSKNYRTHAGGHVRIYERRRIIGLLREAGLRPYAVRYRHALETVYWLSHIAFWSDWGKQGPITRAFRNALDSTRARRSKIVTLLDDIGNRVLPKSIVVYSRKPLVATPSANGHARIAPAIVDETPHEFGVAEHLAGDLEPKEPQQLAPHAPGIQPKSNAAEAVDETPHEFGTAEHLAGDLEESAEDTGQAATEPRHMDGAESGPLDDRSTVEVRAVPAPFDIRAPDDSASGKSGGAPTTLREELRRALALEGKAQKRRLIEILRSCRFALMREVQDLSGEQASMPWTGDGRTVKEVLGHIAGWERWTIAALNEIAEGVREPRIMTLDGYPEGIARYASIDTFNAARMSEARERPWQDVLEESAQTFDRLLAAIDATPPEALRASAAFYWPDIGGTVPCGLYLLMVAAHHYQEEHLPEVKGERTGER